VEWRVSRCIQFLGKEGVACSQRTFGGNMQIGTLVEDLIDGIGVVIDIDHDEDNQEPIYLVHYAYGYRGWYYGGYLEVIDESR
jgi:hypothetical protein